MISKGRNIESVPLNSNIKSAENADIAEANFGRRKLKTLYSNNEINKSKIDSRITQDWSLYPNTFAQSWIKTNAPGGRLMK